MLSHLIRKRRRILKNYTNANPLCDILITVVMRWRWLSWPRISSDQDSATGNSRHIVGKQPYSQPACQAANQPPAHTGRTCIFFAIHMFSWFLMSFTFLNRINPIKFIRIDGNFLCDSYVVWVAANCPLPALPLAFAIILCR